jgi:hypothetical protein
VTAPREVIRRRSTQRTVGEASAGVDPLPIPSHRNLRARLRHDAISRRYHRRVAEQHEKSLSEQLEEIGSRLAWVRDYL